MAGGIHIVKLIQQTILERQAGQREQVYEVDLCEVSANKFVINFRYGIRGETLKEGTKTVFPVYRSVAEKIFHDLIDEKRAEGYRPPGEAGTVLSFPGQEAGESLSRANTARRQAILHHLQQAAEGSELTGKWKLSRIIWRTGEMKLAEAVPLLLQLAGQGSDMQQYSLVWALGRCALPEDSQKVARVLAQYYGNPNSTEATRRIAAEGLCRLQQETQQDEFFESLLTSLPTGLQESIRHEDAEGLARKVREYVFTLKTTSNDYLITLYHLSQRFPHVHQTLLDVFAGIPLKPGYFKQIRSLFKMAEWREDSEMYGLLAYRFEQTPEYYTPDWRYRIRNRRYQRVTYVSGIGDIEDIQQEYTKDRPRIAYSSKTRAYFRRRIIRTLRRTGELEDLTYTDLATDILLQYCDERDRTAPYKTTSYSYSYRPFRQIPHHTHYDSYARSLLLYYILYANSPRYHLKKGADAWNCVSPYEPGQPAPDVREEAFPELWNQAPSNLLTLLLHSRCGRVHEFAAKAFRDVPDYAALVSIDHIIALITQPYDATNALALELAQQQYSPLNPNKELVHALIECQYLPARETARGWIEANPDAFFQDSEFVCRLIFSPQADIRQWMRTVLPACLLSELQQKSIITKTIASLLALKVEDAEDEFVRDVSEILLLAFPRAMYKLGLDVVRDLLQHPHVEVQALGGRILLKHRTPAKDLPDDLFMALFQAGSPHIRALGVQLLGQLPDIVLLNKEQVFASFCLSESPEMRKAAKPVIGRLASKNKEFGDHIAAHLYSAFLFKESSDGLHQDLYRLFTEELSGSVDVFDPSKTWNLLHSKHLQANLLGAYIVKHTQNIEHFTMPQIVSLAGNELHDLRETAWNFYRRHPDRIKQEAEAALGIVDSRWDDTRVFAFEYFRSTFTEQDWTPDLLVSLCDSTREDVRAFGRSMITRFFDEKHGADYLLRLSQHPSADLQVFATNYLEGYASGHLGRIRKLEPYFVTILSQVCKGRVAKDRVFHFLQTEALNEREAAVVAARILTRQSATMAIGDKAACIEILRDIHQTYPDLETPLKFKDAPVYGKTA